MEPRVKPCQPVKGKPNVLMFVGLQGFGKTPFCNPPPTINPVLYYGSATGKEDRSSS